jgi:hypothetical protein
MKDTDQAPSTGSNLRVDVRDGIAPGVRVTSTADAPAADSQAASATSDASASTAGATATAGNSKPSLPKQAAPAAETPSDPNAGLVVSKTTRAAITQAQQNRAPRSAPAK